MSCKFRKALGAWKRARKTGVKGESEFEVSPQRIDRRLRIDPEPDAEVEHHAGDEDPGSQAARGFGRADVFVPQLGLRAVGAVNGGKVGMFVRGGHNFSNHFSG